MTNQPKYTGGVFRFIPFEGTSWIQAILHDGLDLLQIRFMLVLIGLVLLGFLVTLLRIVSRTRRRRYRIQVSQTSFESCTLLDCQMSEGSSLTSRTPESYDMQRPLLHTKQTNSVPVLDSRAFDLKRKVSGKYQEYRNEDSREDSEETDLSLPMVSELPLKEVSYEISGENLISQSSSKSPKIEDSMSVRMEYRKRVKILSSVAALFSICLLAHIISLIVVVTETKSVSDLLNQLPDELHRLALNTHRFANDSLDISYNITCAHLINDASRTDNGSHLRTVVNFIKNLGAEAVTCLAYGCSLNPNVNYTDNLFIPPSMKIGDSEKRKHMAASLVSNFDLVLDRLKHLNHAKMLLNSSFITKLGTLYLEYRLYLMKIIPPKPILGTTDEKNSINEDFSFSKTLNYTATLLCSEKQANDRGQFESCDQVRAFLLQFANYADHLPTTLPGKSLASVVPYSLFPQDSHAEKFIMEWMPVFNDLPGQGAQFLFRKYLQPEVEEIKRFLTNTISVAPSETIGTSISRYRLLFVNSLIVLCAVLAVCGLAVTLFMIFLAKRFWNSYRHDTGITPSTSSSLDSGIEQSFSLKSSSLKVFKRKRSPCCFILALVIVASFFVSLTILGLLLTFASNLVQTQFCLYLFKGPAQQKADAVLTERLEVTVAGMTSLHQLITTPYLHLKMPYPILTTLDSAYQPGQLPLLSSMHINRPVNFTAFLDSEWFNNTLFRAWDREVMGKVQEVQFHIVIPPLSLTGLFEGAISFTQLDKSYDSLNVGNVDDYLINPGPPYLQTILDALEKIRDKVSREVLSAYREANKRYVAYENAYHAVKEALQEIQENKIILQPISLLIGNASLAMNNFNRMSDAEIVRLIDQILRVGWLRSLPVLQQELAPFVYGLLDDLFPFPGLRNIYRQSVGPVCAPPDGSILEVQSAPPEPVVPKLERLGVSIFVDFDDGKDESDDQLPNDDDIAEVSDDDCDDIDVSGDYDDDLDDGDSDGNSDGVDNDDDGDSNDGSADADVDSDYDTTLSPKRSQCNLLSGTTHMRSAVRFTSGASGHLRDSSERGLLGGKVQFE
ncbi:unnamed protein product [Calicophoron daubneyi]|uniref:Uncharacterized protein n=1 Tax=Calicophoron daubneyi TaxID=300641 RepID=A0AAV2T1H0_CALDB